MTSFFRSLNSLIRIRRTSLGLALVVALALCVVGVVRTRQAFGHDQDVQKLNRFVQTPRSNPAAMKAFREGRDLIEGEKWQQAAEKFDGFINEFPKDRDVDAALTGMPMRCRSKARKTKLPRPYCV